MKTFHPTTRAERLTFWCGNGIFVVSQDGDTSSMKNHVPQCQLWEEAAPDGRFFENLITILHKPMGEVRMATERTLKFKSEKVDYTAIVVYGSQEEIISCADKFVVWNLQREARNGKLPKNRTFRCNWKGEPELSEEEKVRALLAGLTPERRALIAKLMGEMEGTNVPQEAVEVVEDAPENVPHETSSTKEEDVPEDLDARIAKYSKWDVKKLRARCEQLDIEHEDLTRDEMAEEIAMNE